MAFNVADYKTSVHNNWCPGCGDFGILNAIQMSLMDMQLDPERVTVFSGVGCSSKTPHYINTYGVHTLHGRVLPFATGGKLANPEMTVLAVGGDGDGLGIGAGHFVATGRLNLDITYIMFNNGVYGLTKGQASPTLHLGQQTKSLPNPNIIHEINPLILALSSGYTFIARGYAYDVAQLKALIRQGIEHPGLSFIDILQPCPTYNNINTRDWFGGADRKGEDGKAMPRVYKLDPNLYDPLISAETTDEEIHQKIAAFFAKATEWGDQIPSGVLLQNLTQSTYEERVIESLPKYKKNPPAKRQIESDNKPVLKINTILDELRVA